MVIFRRAMMKKLVKLLIAVMCVLALTAGVLGCFGGVPGDSDSVKEPTSGSVEPASGSESEESGSESEESGSESQSTHVHAFGTEWKSDGSFHWHECECGEKADKAAHVITALTVKTQPTKITYLVGDEFDKTGMEVEGTCVCGTLEVTDYTVEYADGETSLKYGDTSVTIRRGDVTTTLSVTVERNAVEKPAADETVFTYNGSEQIYVIPASELYTVSGNKQTDAGEYTVTVALKDKEHTEWADKTTDDLTFTFTIAKLSAAAKWNVAEEYVYKDIALAAPTAKIVGADGKDIALTVTGDVLDSKGEHTFTATTDNGNYTLTNATCTVTVKLYNEITGLEFSDIAYGETPSYNKGGLSAVHGAPEFTYSLEENGEYVSWENIEKKVGKYYVKAYIAENDGYIAVTAYASFNVVKGENSVAIETAKQIYTCKETPSVTAAATHGEVIVKYSETENGEFGVTITFVPGKTYYSKATVAESEFYKGAESSVISFAIANHVFEDGKCTVCGEYNTMGVIYDYNASKDCYYVRGEQANKTLDVAELTILSRYNDGTNGEKEVKYINTTAFQGNPYIKKVVLPESVVSLEGLAFADCANLEYVSMTGVSTMNWATIYNGKDGDNNFLDCMKLKTVIIGTVFSTNCQQFVGRTAPEAPILELYVNGNSGEPTLAGNNNLFSGTVYHKGNADKCGEWNYDTNGEVVHGHSEHNFTGEKCEYCGEYNTMGAAYAYDEGNDCYYVGDNRTLNVAELTVLSGYNDGTHGEKAVTYVQHSAFAENPYIRKVILPESVNNLDGSVFRACPELEYVAMPGVTALNYGEIARPYGMRDGNNNFLNCTKLRYVIISTAFSTNVQQFLATGETSGAILDLFVNGASGVPKFETGTNQNLLTGNVYYKGDGARCLQWNFDSDGNLVHGPAAHNYVNGICSVCGEKNAMGVRYEYDAAKQIYYVASYSGTGDTVNVFGTWDDGVNGEADVKYIAAAAFKDNVTIKKVILDVNIVSLEGRVFWGCENLEYVSMTGITNLDYASPYGGERNNNFRNCFKLKTVVVSTALSSNVGQFGCGAADTGNKKILDFYVYGASGAPALDYETADANNLCSGNVYYYSETELGGAWHYADGVATLW